MTELQDLPEGCIASVISLTTPSDACRLSLIFRDFKSEADSDSVCNKFIPAETNEIISHAKSKKELMIYLTLSDSPILIDDGKMSFSLDKWSGKKCYMIDASRLRIVYDTPIYRTWQSLSYCRFKEVAKLHIVSWFEICGKIERRMLSPLTTYKAYPVYKLTERAGTDLYGNIYRLYWPFVVTAGARAYGFDHGIHSLKKIVAGIQPSAFLAPQRPLQQGRFRSHEILTSKSN